MKKTTKGKICKISAVVIDVAAPLAATISQFPVWVDRSAGATVSGVFILCAFLSAIPLFKQIKAYFKSPSAWVMWCIVFVALAALRAIIDEIVFICLVGVIANLIGAGVYKIGEHYDKPPDKNDDSGGV